MIGTEIQKAVYDALTAGPALAGGNVFDHVPDASPFPRVTIGEEQIVNDDNACGSGWEAFTDIHVWSRKPGYAEAKPLAATVVERIEAISSISGFRLMSVDLQDQRSLTDPDGATVHIVCSFRFIVDET